MGDRHVLALVVFGADMRGEGQACLFLDRQGVELGAQHQRRAGSVLQNSYQAGAADMLGDVEPGGAGFLGQALGGLDLVAGQFGMTVQVAIERFERGIILVDG